MTDRLDAEHVADLALGPVRTGNDVGDAVHFGIVRGQLDDDAGQYLVLVEGKVMVNHEVAGERPVVGADADHVTGVQVTKNVPADGL